MSKLSVKETVSLLKELFKISFGGKEGGRYKISIERLLHLSGSQFSSPRWIEEIQEEAAEQGVAIINVGASYSVIEMTILKGYRNVPPSVVESLHKKMLQK